MKAGYFKIHKSLGKTALFARVEERVGIHGEKNFEILEPGCLQSSRRLLNSCQSEAKSSTPLTVSWC